MGKAIQVIRFLCLFGCICMISACNRMACEYTLFNHSSAPLHLCLSEIDAYVGEKSPMVFELLPSQKKTFRIATDTLKFYLLRNTEKELDHLVLLPTGRQKIRISVEDAQLLSTNTSMDVHTSSSVFSNEDLLPTSILDFQIQVLKHTQAVEQQYNAEKYARHYSEKFLFYADSCARHLKEVAVSLAGQYPYSLLPIYLANQAFLGQLMFNMENEADFLIIKSWSESMQSYIPDNPHLLKLNQHIERIEYLTHVQNL